MTSQKLFHAGIEDTYDANGNRQSAFGLYFEYNGFNQLIRVRENNATGTIIEEYLYDENGERIYKKAGNETTLYVNENFVRTINSSGTFDTVYYYDEKDLIGRLDPDGKKYFYHPDHLGSTTLITNESGQVVEETTYEPYGKVLSGGSDRYDYTGKETDLGTGLAYYGARYYDPAYAQFTQPDSNIPDQYNPQSLNRYSYTLNNPYKYTDPDGNFAVPLVAITTVVFAAGYALSEALHGGDIGSIAAAGVEGATYGAIIGAASPYVIAGGPVGIIALHAFASSTSRAVGIAANKAFHNKPVDITNEDINDIAEAGIIGAIEGGTGAQAPYTPYSSRATTSNSGAGITSQPSQSSRSSASSSGTSTSYTRSAATASTSSPAQQGTTISYEKRGKGYVKIIYQPKQEKQKPKSSESKNR